MKTKRTPLCQLISSMAEEHNTKPRALTQPLNTAYFNPIENFWDVPKQVLSTEASFINQQDKKKPAPATTGYSKRSKVHPPAD